MWTIQLNGERAKVKAAVFAVLIPTVSGVAGPPQHGAPQWSGPGSPADAPVIDDPRSVAAEALTPSAPGDDNPEVFAWAKATICTLIDLLPDTANGVRVDARGGLDSILNLAVTPLVLA